MAFLTTRKAVLLACVCALLATGAYVGVSLYIQRTGDALAGEVQTFADALTHERQYDALETLASASADARTAIDGLILHDEEDTVAFLSAIDDIAAALQISVVTKVLTVEEQKNEPYDILTMTFEVDGSESSVMEMVRVFEELPYHSHVTNADLTRYTDEETGAALLRGTVALAVTIERS